MHVPNFKPVTEILDISFKSSKSLGEARKAVSWVSHSESCSNAALNPEQVEESSCIMIHVKLVGDVVV